MNKTQKKNSEEEKIENMVVKGENAGDQHFLLSHNVFKRLFRWIMKRQD